MLRTALPFLLAYAIGLTVALARAGLRARPAPGVAAPPRKPPSRILVIGASGGTGRQLVSQALERGHAVTAFVRDRSKFTIEDPRLTVRQGDVLDRDSVLAAMQGQDAVVCALGHRQYFRPTRILSDGTRNILDAMVSHGVERLVCETSLGIGDSAGRLGLLYTLFIIPVILPFYFWDKTRQERAIAASGVEWTIVRPGVLTSGARSGRVRSGDNVGSFLLAVRISRADVAGFMLDEVESGAGFRTAQGVSG